MLKTNLDYKILEDLRTNLPKDLFEIDPEEAYKLVRYLKFLKSGTDLNIANINEGYNKIFINELTTGRGNTKLMLNDKLGPFHKSKIPKGFGVHETFFLNDDNNTNQEKYRKNNYHIFGFITDHFQVYKRLALLERKSALPVRTNTDLSEFNSWNELEHYLLPFSDCIIFDPYLFSDHQDIWDQNIGKIIVQLDNAAPVKYNLMIITYISYDDPKNKKQKINIEEVKEYLIKLKTEHSLKANISIIVTSKIEHDRYIFMNYMRIESGIGFNYFNSKSESMVNTEIRFLSYENPDNFDNAEVILKGISGKVKKVLERNNPKEIYGNLENRLLSIKK